MIENDKERYQKKSIKKIFYSNPVHLRSVSGQCCDPCAPKISTKLNILSWNLLFCTTKESYTQKIEEIDVIKNRCECFAVTKEYNLHRTSISAAAEKQRAR